MLFRLLKVTFILLSCATYAFGQEKNVEALDNKISIEWGNGQPSGIITISNGSIDQIKITLGKGKVTGNKFQFTSSGRSRVSLSIRNSKNNKGPGATQVFVKTAKSPFSFFLRDVTKNFPVYIPDYSVAVLVDSDNRSLADLRSDKSLRGFQTKLQKIESEPEESFASVEKRSLRQTVPTWLGVSRDFRIFQIAESLPGAPQEANLITPRFSSSPLVLPRVGNHRVTYTYTVGRGVSVEINTLRRLEDGVLPILHSTHIDDDIEYHSTSFVGLEHSPLTNETVKGTHYLVADKYNGGSMLTKQQEEAVKPELAKAFNTTEETVLYFRSEIKNIGKVPRYAWFKTLKPGFSWAERYPYSFDPVTGFSAYSKDTIFSVSKLDGQPLANEEMAILLQPGEKAAFEFFLPHSPVTEERAKELSRQSFEQKLTECRNFWMAKLKKAARIQVPEKRIEEMLQAGLLHLDLTTYGNEPGGTLSPTIGVYGPIGTESSPITQFYNSMGWDDVAKRSLMYFLDKQHDDGFMQNFGGYMVETGAALWSMGEYFRYTNDKEWIKKIAPKMIRSTDFLLRWRDKSKLENLKGKGFGMIDGKVADPEDHFHQFMLNAYAYLGLSRVAEMLAGIDPAQSDRISREALAWKEDIRESFFNAMGKSAVVPLGDGTWSPTVPPWTEATNLRALLAINEKYFSHGTFSTSDALLGPLYLVFCEVLDVTEPASKMMLEYHSEIFYQHNAAFSQPYYSRHNWVQAKLGLVKPFLKTYYNTFSALADRDTYTFWEHLYHVSPHKTHEEAWFLMETRWMLYLEDSATLRLLNTIPRKWMEDGKVISMDNVQSYFGPLTVNVNSQVSKGFIEASIQCDSDRKPKQVTIRLPHPEGKKAVKITGGQYIPGTETILVNSFSGQATVHAEF